MSSIDRLIKYKIKTNPDRIKGVVEEMKTHMETAEASCFDELRELETLTRSVLCEASVPTINFGMYHAYTKEIWGKKRRFHGGGSFQAEVELLVYKWSHRGLDRSVLTNLALSIFDIIIPPEV
jgi:hypothetical protein